MNTVDFFHELNPTYILACAIISLGVSFLFYQRFTAGNKAIRLAFLAARSILIFLILLLLLNPLLRYLDTEQEKPIVVLAIDNSLSVKLSAGEDGVSEARKALSTLKENLEERNVEVNVQSLSGESILDSLGFSAPTTNISNLLNGITERYEGANLSRVMLLSDGVVNRGFSPEYQSYPIKMDVIGIGDTTPKKDVMIQSVASNKFTFLGNKFPVTVNVRSFGFKGEEGRLSIYGPNNELIETKTFNFDSDGELTKISYYLTANSKGIKKYRVALSKKEGEFLTDNNSKFLFIEVIENRKKVLIAGSSPHPDLKVIRRALEESDNYKVELYLPGIHPFPSSEQDLVIFHQIPETSNKSSDLLSTFSGDKYARWFIAGVQTNFSKLNNVQDVLAIYPKGQKMDNVTGFANSTFQRFTIKAEDERLLEDLPPMQVMFGDYKSGVGSETILYQQLGRLTTDMPLLTVSTQGEHKTAVLAGTGLWLWWQHEYVNADDHTAIKSLIRKMVDYLIANDDKKQFRCSPLETDLAENQRVLFETEIFNDIYEPIYNRPVTLRISNDSGIDQSFDYVYTKADRIFDAGIFPPGVYNYKATTALNDGPLSESGQFYVKPMELEALQTTANFNVLKQLAENHDGKFYSFNQWDDLLKEYKENSPKPILRTFEQIKDIINLHWLLYLFIALASLEWAGRKFIGRV